MRRGMAALGVALIVALSPIPVAHAADYYRVSVRRLDKDLYRDESSRVLIKTKYCYEYAYGEEAILVWDGPYSWDNKLIFTSSGSTCDVEGVYRG